jgi:nitrogen fixation-related uncharacterized protein
MIFNIAIGIFLMACVSLCLGYVIKAISGKRYQDKEPFEIGCVVLMVLIGAAIVVGVIALVGGIVWTVSNQ